MKPRRRRRIAVVTTSRADYGLLYWLIAAIRTSPSLELSLVATGMHLAPGFGRTVGFIRKDGFPIAAEVPFIGRGDSPLETARSLGLGIGRLSPVLARLNPALVVILGDRFEMLAAACAALCLRLPLAHIHGGEATFGVIDDQIRHAVTKMSLLHFVSAEAYRRRVIQMGEHPSRVFNVGAPGLEYIDRLKPVPTAPLARTLRFDLQAPYVMATYHPDGSSPDALLEALRAAGLRAVFTYANADAGGRRINAVLERWRRRHPRMIALASSLGQDEYLTLLGRAQACVGNSSSGIIEAPALSVPTVNIGERQAGRLRAPSVIDCAPGPGEIAGALRRALSPSWRRNRCRGQTPYGGGRVSERITRVLRAFPLRAGEVRKDFRDLPAAARTP